MTNRKQKQKAPATAATPPDPFIEGMFFAMKQFREVLWERRQGMHRLEEALRNAPEAHQRIISDVLEPLGGGVQENVLGTVGRRLEDRLMQEAQRRMDEKRTADATPAPPVR